MNPTPAPVTATPSVARPALATAVAGLVAAAASGTPAQVPGEPAPPPPVDRFEPKPYRIDSFSDVWSKSPFAFEVIIDEEEDEGPGPFEDLALMGFSQKGDVYYATLFNQKDLKGPRILINSSAPNEDGYQLVKVERGGTYKDTKILVQKGEESDYVSYDSKRLATQPTGAVGGAPAQRPNQPGGRNQPNQGNRTNQPDQQANANNPNAPQPGRTAQPAGNAAANNAQQSRNEVIQRLLERARQNRENANANNNNGDNPPRRRRVVLPPSNNN